MSNYLDSTPSVYQLFDNPPRRLVNGWISAGVVIVVCLVVFAILFTRHKGFPRDQVNRKLRNKYLVIISMLPVYSLTAYISLFFMRAAVVFEFIRSVYEAASLFVFYLLLIQLLGGKGEGVRVLEQHLFPKFNLNVHTKLKIARNGVLQLCFVHPIVDILAIILALNGKYEPGVFAKDNAFPYLTVISVISMVFAMICLIGVYKATREVLSPFRTTWKFVTIKVLLLLNVLQRLVLSILVKAGAITDDEVFSHESKAEAWQNWLLVFEISLSTSYTTMHHLHQTLTPNIHTNIESTALLSAVVWQAFPVSDYARFNERHPPLRNSQMPDSPLIGIELPK